jgi:TonB family protein
VAAAPAGLAATVTGAALAGGIALAGSTAATSVGAATTFMSITKLQLGISSALAIAGATGLVVQAGANAELREEVVRLRQESTAVTPLQRENDRLARNVAEVVDMKRDDAEFTRLQEEAAALRTRMQQLARAEEARAAAAAKSNAEVYDIARLDQAPRAKFQARPSYPPEMRAAGTSGEVVVDFVVDANGDVQKAYAMRSSQREFEAAAVEAVSKWKFQPGQKGGRAVNTHLQVPIVFTLNGAPTAPALMPKTSEAGADTVKLSPFTVETTKP